MTYLDRQSFLEADSDERLRNVTVGLVGLGGGGSHVALQLAHLGVGNYVVADEDFVEDTNLNRLVGATWDDVANKCLKVDIAIRVIRGVMPNARIQRVPTKWQLSAAQLKACDVIIGGLDSISAKDELDAFCKRFLIPYIDMGMDVHPLGEKYMISGQVILTSPGGPCLRCLGLVNDDILGDEQRRYGAAGSKPQVVWPNGVLASTAVGLFTQLICPWHAKAMETAYLVYDGNRGILNESPRLKHINGQCPHRLPAETGDPGFDIRKPWEPPAAATEPNAVATEASSRSRLVQWILALVGK